MFDVFPDELTAKEYMEIFGIYMPIAYLLEPLLDLDAIPSAYQQEEKAKPVHEELYWQVLSFTTIRLQKAYQSSEEKIALYKQIYDYFTERFAEGYFRDKTYYDDLGRLRSYILIPYLSALKACCLVDAQHKKMLFEILKSQLVYYFSYDVMLGHTKNYAIYAPYKPLDGVFLYLLKDAQQAAKTSIEKHGVDEITRKVTTALFVIDMWLNNESPLYFLSDLSYLHLDVDYLKNTFLREGQVARYFLRAAWECFASGRYRESSALIGIIRASTSHQESTSHQKFFDEKFLKKIIRASLSDEKARRFLLQLPPHLFSSLWNLEGYDREEIVKMLWRLWGVNLGMVRAGDDRRRGILHWLSRVLIYDEQNAMLVFNSIPRTLRRRLARYALVHRQKLFRLFPKKRLHRLFPGSNFATVNPKKFFRANIRFFSSVVDRAALIGYMVWILDEKIEAKNKTSGGVTNEKLKHIAEVFIKEVSALCGRKSLELYFKNYHNSVSEFHKELFTTYLHYKHSVVQTSTPTPLTSIQAAEEERADASFMPPEPVAEFIEKVKKLHRNLILEDVLFNADPEIVRRIRFLFNLKDVYLVFARTRSGDYYVIGKNNAPEKVKNPKAYKLFFSDVEAFESEEDARLFALRYAADRSSLEEPVDVFHVKALRLPNRTRTAFVFGEFGGAKAVNAISLREPLFRQHAAEEKRGSGVLHGYYP